jgi:hypothetical protein
MKAPPRIKIGRLVFSGREMSGPQAAALARQIASGLAAGAGRGGKSLSRENVSVSVPSTATGSGLARQILRKLG